MILTIRDEDGWWKSFKKMQDKFYDKPLLRTALLVSPTGLRLGKYADRVCKFAKLRDFSVVLTLFFCLACFVSGLWHQAR